jgi:PRTRC genetic system protein E
MNTNFFNQIAQLHVTGDLHLAIAKGAENNLVVSVMLQNQGCGDNAKNIIPPLNLCGTAEELDNGFFEAITMPLESASGLMVDMESFMKQLEEAKKHSAIEKEKADKQIKEAQSKDKRYKDSMIKADELEKEGKFREAWMKVPEIAEFPEKADEIRRRKASLSERFSSPSLFGALEEEKKQTPKEQETTVQYSGDEMEAEQELEEDAEEE